MNNIISYWRGERSLGITFWGLWVVLVLSQQGMIFFLDLKAQEYIVLEVNDLIFYTVMYLLTLYFSVATWRSAQMYKSNLMHSSSLNWGVSAQIFVLLLLVSALMEASELISLPMSPDRDIPDTLIPAYGG